MPLSVRTLTPLEPSAGYGPPVSSGISSEDVVVALVEPCWPDVEEESLEPGAQAASATRPAPLSRPSARRRLSKVGRSCDSPRS